MRESSLNMCHERLVLLSLCYCPIRYHYRRCLENILAVDLTLCVDMVNFEGVEYKSNILEV